MKIPNSYFLFIFTLFALLGCAANTTPSIRTDSSTPIKSSSDSQKKKEIDDLYRTILKRTEGIP